MSRIKELIDKLKQADEQNQTQAIFQIVIGHKAQIIDANQLQLFSGRNARGEVLGQYRDEGYAEYKSRLNPLPGLGVWDLRLSGSLYDGMYIEENGNFPIAVNSSDSKADRFRDASPFGLNEKSKEELREEVKPEIQTYYRNLFQL